MKAAVIRAFGAPDRIHVEEVPTPVPGPGQVLVKVLAAGVNRLDHYVRLGHINPKLTFPHVLGSDAAGEVAELGPGVAGFKVGERVIAMPGYPLDPAHAGIRPATAAPSYAIPGAHMQGTYAQYALVPQAWLLHDTTGLPVEQAAALPVGLLIAVRSVQIVGEVKAGDHVLVHAGGSATGIMCLQVARALGAKVAVTVRKQSSAQIAKDLGAELVIDSTQEDFVAPLMKWTGGHGVDVAIDNLGGEVLARTIDAVRPMGIVVAMGFMAGVQVSFDVRNFFFAQKQLRGTLIGDIEDFTRMCEPIRAGRIRPVIDAVYPLAKAAIAHERIAADQARGSLVLLPWA